MVVALLGHLFEACLSFGSLWSVPPGTAIRPMGLAALCFLVAVLTLVIAGALLLVAICLDHSGRTRAIAVLGVILALLPLVTASLCLNWIIRQHGLVDAG